MNDSSGRCVQTNFGRWWGFATVDDDVIESSDGGGKGRIGWMGNAIIANYRN